MSPEENVGIYILLLLVGGDILKAAALVKLDGMCCFSMLMLY